MGGRKGHLAIMDWARAQLVTELQVKETTRDVQFLHNESFFAAAQKKYVYVYDKRGIEVHCLKVRMSFACHVRSCRRTFTAIVTCVHVGGLSVPVVGAFMLVGTAHRGRS